MANVGTDTTDSPKRAPRKRAVRRVVSSTTSTTTRKPRAATRASSSVARATSTSTTTRKAPTAMSETRASKKSPKKYIIIGIALVVFISAAWIGSSDSGAIDVNAKLTEKRQKDADNANSAEGNNSASGETVIPVQEVPAAALNLRGRGAGTTSVTDPVETPAEEVSTSTDAVGTTTDNGTEESSDNTETEPEPEAEVPVEETPVVGQ